MKTRDEISAMLGGFVDAKPDEQGTLIAGVLDEFDECRNEAEQFTNGCPDGASNWHEAYDNLRKDYVKAFLNDDNKPNDDYQNLMVIQLPLMKLHRLLLRKCSVESKVINYE